MGIEFFLYMTNVVCTIKCPESNILGWLLFLDVQKYDYKRANNLTTCYKIIRGDINVSLNDSITLSTYTGTRGHPLKLFKQQSRIDVRKFSFVNRIVDVWNDLPTPVIEAKTVDSFRAKLNDAL